MNTYEGCGHAGAGACGFCFKALKNHVANLEKRLKEIEAWVDFWESYDSGWNKRRKKKS